MDNLNGHHVELVIELHAIFVVEIDKINELSLETYF